MRNVVIGGGTGFVGSALVRAFQKRGVSPTIISRMPGPFRISWHDLERNGLPKDTTVVINVAGQNILDPMQRWTPGFKQNVWNSRVATTKALANAVAAARPKVFITISGVAYYKPNETEYTEESKCEKYDFLSVGVTLLMYPQLVVEDITGVKYAWIPEYMELICLSVSADTIHSLFSAQTKLCHEWEEAAKLPEDSGVRQVIIRSGVVLGRNGGMIQQIFLPFYFGFGGPIGSGTQYMPWIHIKDLTNMFIYATENDKVSGIMNGVAPQIITNGQFTNAFASALWRPAKIPIPTFALSMLFNEERSKIMTEGQKVVPKRVLESGFEYQYPDINAACKEFAKLRYIEDSL